MRDLLSWNLSLGRWTGVEVRVHVFSILLFVLALHIGFREGLVAYALATQCILLLSVAAHELGHCMAAWRMGRNVDQVILWPLGGLTNSGASHHPHHELIISVSGIMANLALCVVMAALVIPLDPSNALALLNPLRPPVPEGAGLTYLALLQAAFWINWMLVVINLLPATPLDGSRALRAMLWPRYGYQTAVLVVAAAAQITAVALWLSAWIVHDLVPYATLPLVMLGLLVFFVGRQDALQADEADKADDAVPADDYGAGYAGVQTALSSTAKPRQPGLLRRWLDERRAQRERAEREKELEEELRADEILAKLHEVGRDALSADERALLDRVSQRYRNRLQQ